MGQFGEFLVERGALSEVELDEVIRFQSVYGGRVGTVASDLGYVVVEELAGHLAAFHGVPIPPPEWTEAPEAAALRNVPPQLVRRYKLLPLKLENTRLHVAMLDPGDGEQLEFLAMASDREVVPYVLPERQLLYWLEVHLGIDRPPRFLGMVTRPRKLGLTDEEAASATPLPGIQRSPASPPAPEGITALPPIALSEPEAAAMAPSSATVAPAGPSTSVRPPAKPASDEILLLDELVAEAPTSAHWEAPEELGAPPPSHTVGAVPRFSGHVSHLESRLFGSENRDEIIGVGLEIALHYACSAALFVVRRDQVSLFRALGPDGPPDAAHVEVPLATPSVFSHPALTRMPFRGAPAVDGIDGRLMHGLGRPDVQEMLVHPVVIRERTVNLLYADNGPDAFGETSIAALSALCSALANAYERLITARKKQSAAHE